MRQQPKLHAAARFAVYGATRDTPEEIRSNLARLRSLAGDFPFGVDLVLPPKGQSA